MGRTTFTDCSAKERCQLSGPPCQKTPEILEVHLMENLRRGPRVSVSRGRPGRRRCSSLPPGNCPGNRACVTGGLLVASTHAQEGKISFFMTPGFRESRRRAEKTPKDSPFVLLLLVILQKSATSLCYFSILQIYMEKHKQVKKMLIPKHCQPAVKVTACPYPCRWGYISDKTIWGLLKNSKCFC